MKPADAEALLERAFPTDQCHPNPTKLMFESSNGPHNFTTIPVYNAYAYAVRQHYAATQRAVG